MSAYDFPTVPVLLQLAESIPDITSHELCQTATDIRKSLNDTRLEVERERKSQKQPFLEGGQRVDAHAKELTKPLQDSIDAIDIKLKVYAEHVDMLRQSALRQQLEAQLEALSLATSATPSAMPPDIAATQVDMPTPAPIRTRQHTEVEIFSTTLIPDEYWMLDKVAIRRDLLAGIEVAGARLINVNKLA